jgi:hypothetical protein
MVSSSPSLACALAAAFAKSRGEKGFTPDELNVVITRATPIIAAAQNITKAINGEMRIDLENGIVVVKPNAQPPVATTGKAAKPGRRR